MNKSKVTGYIFIILTMIMWGFSFLSIKISLAAFPPMTLAFLRFLMASLVLFVIYKIFTPKVKLSLKDLPLFILSSALGVTLYFFFENNAINLITASEASLISSLVPILTLIADFIVFKTKVTRLKVLSIILSVFGVYLIVGLNFSHGKYTLLGYLLMFFAAVDWVIYAIITKPLFKKYSFIPIVFFQTIIGTVLFIPFVFFEKINISAINWTVNFNMIYLGIFCSAIAYCFYVYSMDKLGLDISALFLNLVPVVTVIAGFFLLKESVSFIQIVGGVIVVLSVYLANWNGKFFLPAIFKREVDSE